MVLAEGQSPMNWPTKPLSARARAILTECSSGSSIYGIVSSFLTNFGASLATGFFPDDANSFLNASSAEIGEEGGGSPPPGVTMEAAWSCATNPRGSDSLHDPNQAVLIFHSLRFRILDLNRERDLWVFLCMYISFL
jgi:hypothetical protein